MAHYALLDETNIVTTVITGKDEDTDGVNWEEYYGNLYGKTCKRTSYNATVGKYKDPSTHLNVDTEGYRKNFAVIGGKYWEEYDCFSPRKEHDSWVLNTSSCNWEAPTPYPSGSDTGSYNGPYDWDEASLTWVTSSNWEYRTELGYYTPLKPYDSWIFDTDIFFWKAPIDYPSGDATGSYTGSYVWDESSTNWITQSV